MAIDPRFTDQARAFIVESMKQGLPNANVDGGSGINAVLGRGGATISASLLQEIEHLLTSRKLTDPEAVSEDDMDLLLDNLLTERDEGNYSSGFVRVYYRERTRREFGAGLTATIETSEINFVTIADLVFEPQNYFLDNDRSLYYINVPFIAQEPGEDYNVDVGEINKLVNDTSGALLVTNASAFRNGLKQQTNAQALRLAQRSVSTRTPLPRDGAIYWMQKLFGTKLRDLLVIGNGDAEMLRDEIYDLGTGFSPQFRIGVDGLDADGAQQGTSLEIHVGGRTDLYLLFDAVNYVQQHADLFADMTLDNDMATPATVTEIFATFVEGTTGTVPNSGKLLIDLGGGGEEVVYYGDREIITAPDEYRFFDLAAAPVNTHNASASIKVVNNEELSVGEDGDITILPVFQIAEIRLLDPLTFEPIGDPVPETTSDSREPGWYVSKANAYDILSAKETKSIILDEKRDEVGNQLLEATGGDTVDVGDYSKYTVAGADFTGYQGREIQLTGGVVTTRTIIRVISATEVFLNGALLGTNASVDALVAASYGDYIQYPVRISYYTHTEIAEAQNFLDQSSSRIMSSDSLARAFLPVFLDFTLEYQGDGETLDVRDRVNKMLKTSSGEAIGESEGARFEYSDLVSAAYEDGLANYVVTPFQVRIRRLQSDGTWIVQYVNPGPDTINELAVDTAVAVSDTFIATTLPANVTEFNVPAQGKLYLGGFTTNQEVLEYDSVATSGDDYVFVLKDGQAAAYVHGVNEPLKVSTLDYVPANVITDGVITNERNYRPFLGQAIIRKLDS